MHSEYVLAAPRCSPKFHIDVCNTRLTTRVHVFGWRCSQVLTKFYEKFVEGKKSEFIDDDGNVIKVPGAQYEDNGVRKLY